jgi:hypothetical protein
MASQFRNNSLILLFLLPMNQPCPQGSGLVGQASLQELHTEGGCSDRGDRLKVLKNQGWRETMVRNNLAMNSKLTPS